MNAATLPGVGRFTKLVDRDKLGYDANYLAACADPIYEAAFARMLANPQGAAQLMNAAEAEAVHRVGEAMNARSLLSGTGEFGGYAIPTSLDPTIIPTSSGSISPLRQIASVRTIVGHEFKGVSSDGVTASFDAEGEEVSDDTPKLAQPTIIPERGTGWVPFSIEAGEDWAGLREELGRLFADAKANVENEKFTIGAGHASHEPAGVIPGAAEIVKSATEKKLAPADIYELQAKLPPRFAPNARFMSTLTVANYLYKAIGGGSTEPPIFTEDRSSCLGRPWHENSVMDAAYESQTKKVMLYGDFEYFRIVDRIGASVELVPHVFGKTNLRPVGERGLWFMWRTSSAVLSKAAFRALEIK